MFISSRQPLQLIYFEDLKSYDDSMCPKRVYREKLTLLHLQFLFNPAGILMNWFIMKLPG